MSEKPGLEQQAHEFATDLSRLLSAFLGRTHPFHAVALEDAFVVEPEIAAVLHVGARGLFSLTARYLCSHDHAQRYLVVHESSIKVHPGPAAKGDPLFRYEYVHDQAVELPSAHLHVHAHRDQFATAMALAGVEGAARRHKETGADWVKAGKLSALHFPMGGHRFRPGLEDVLQMLVVEFGVRHAVEWPAELAAARERFRRSQTGSVVRDCPTEAVRVLRELGYDICDPGGGPAADRVDRLQSF